MKQPVNPIDIHLGKKVREIRKLAGISQEMLGELVGVAPQQIQKYEVAKSRISSSRLYEFSQLLEKPISAFYEGCVRDEYYHNIDFRSEEELQIIDKKHNRETEELIKAFNQISSFDVKMSLIHFVKSLGK
ncbi:MAG: transcriptional regulator with XRE-family HTH domain [Rickettsiales bacterium]|jgi:transcriptional regulator with XRE-family HTH domain